MTLIKVVLVMLSYVKVLKVFWKDAPLKKILTKQKSKKFVTKTKTPYELWYGRQPNVSCLKSFGCKINFLLIRRKKRVEFTFL